MRIYRRPKTDRLGHPVLDAAGQQALDDCYTFEFTYQNQRIKRRTPFSDKRRAEQLARQRLKELEEGSLASPAAIPARRQTGPAPCQITIGQLCAAYEATPLEANPATRHQNTLCLRVVVRLALRLGHGAEVDARPVTLLSPDLVAAYIGARRAEAQGADDQARSAQIQRTANSTLRQAASLLSPKVLATLKRGGLDDLPDFRELRDAIETERFSRVAKLHWNPPGDDVLGKTLREWAEMKDRNLFLAIGLALSCGLRAGEIGQARWDWFTARNGAPFLDSRERDDISVDVKNRTGLIQVTPLDPWWTTLHTRARVMGWLGTGTELVIQGSTTYRDDSLWRQLSAWLDALGWMTTKKAHALRAYAGSMVALKFGIYEASRWCRHSSVKVTEDHYAYFVGRQQGLDPDAIPVHWATTLVHAAPANFTPQILSA